MTGPVPATKTNLPPPRARPEESASARNSCLKKAAGIDDQGCAHDQEGQRRPRPHLPAATPAAAKPDETSQTPRLRPPASVPPSTTEPSPFRPLPQKTICFCRRQWVSSPSNRGRVTPAHSAALIQTEELARRMELRRRCASSTAPLPQARAGGRVTASGRASMTGTHSGRRLSRSSG